MFLGTQGEGDETDGSQGDRIARSQEGGVGRHPSSPPTSPTAPSSSSSALLSSQTPATDALRASLQRFYYDSQWSSPFPQHPSSPLLYLPEAFRKLRWEANSFGVMLSEVEVLSAGLMDDIPLGYYPLKSSDLTRCWLKAEETHRNVLKRQAERHSGAPMEKATDANPSIDAEDAAILETTIDCTFELQRHWPSLTLLLQRPTYTEMSAESPEQRHHSRLRRMVPGGGGMTQDAAQQETNYQLSSPSRPTAGEAEEEGTNGGAGGSAEAQWKTGVHQSFRFARRLDTQFEAFVKELTVKKFGLDGQQLAHRQCALQAWQQVMAVNPVPKRLKLWGRLLRFSTQYGGPPPNGASYFQAIRAMDYTPWRPMLRVYTSLLDTYVRDSPERLRARRAALAILPEECGEKGAINLTPITAAGEWAARRTAGHAADAAAAPGGPAGGLYPVRILPVFPSGYTETAHQVHQRQQQLGGERISPRESETERLGERAQALSHVCLPGAVVSEEVCLRGGPHLLVNGSSLLCAAAEPSASQANKSSTSTTASEVVRDGDTVAYHTLKGNTFEPLYIDDDNTSSYLFSVRNQQQLQAGAGFEAELQQQQAQTGQSYLCGETGLDGSVVCYDRVGVREYFQKAALAAQLPYDEYVVSFSEMSGEAEEELDTDTLSGHPPNRKRSRDPDDGGRNTEEDTHSHVGTVRVKSEGAS